MTRSSISASHSTPRQLASVIEEPPIAISVEKRHTLLPCLIGADLPGSADLASLAGVSCVYPIDADESPISARAVAVSFPTGRRPTRTVLTAPRRSII